jgi:hypothetical protein
LAENPHDDFIRRLLELLRDGASRSRYAEQGKARAMRMTAEASAMSLLGAYERLAAQNASM